ncbi:hypothetical protein K6973_05110 [Streptococcus dysgalactiae]|uniref:hypothetical protein n=1 Tax=Streptococcus dysgalactiae TaxID=1334 RepID=UPI001C9D89E8|nr:hypothetical protein [Streptococcus dysgalactiae]QZT28107.1 hypothetical protein K6973_05110 [Streptococcus dysgalactiae]
MRGLNMDLSQKYLMAISTDGSLGDFTLGNNLSAGSYYIDYNDTSKFRLFMDLTFYYATSNSDGIAYTANRNNYKDLNPNNKPQNGYQSFGRVIVDGLEIGRIIVNNDVVYHKSVNVAPGYQKLWSGKLSIDGINVAAYNHYRFVVNDSVYLDKQLAELTGSYDMLADVAIIAKYNSSYNDVNISGFGQDVVAIYGKN